MNIVEKLKEYDFTDFKLGHIDPNESHVAMVMKEVPRDSEKYRFFKEKLDKELGFKEENYRGTYYPTLVKYLALALGEINI